MEKELNGKKKKSKEMYLKEGEKERTEKRWEKRKKKEYKKQ